MKYINGKRAEKHLFEMTPLERAICEFENKAETFHSARKNSSCIQQELARKKAHLDLQRRTTEACAQVQTQLDIYRDEARKKKLLNKEEPHHPTETLAKFMSIEGYPKPDKNCECHHIIQGKGKSQVYATQARLRLHMCGIGINDPDNGVWLPSNINDTPHWAMKKALPHKVIHTAKYDQWVATKMLSANNEPVARIILGNLRRDLQNGDVPLENLTQKSRIRLGL
ncbi:AHH domain-containing protein [Sansalvadorimonas sp. 2012CJ34-2]|uniref:AHH domain-containing protein n=1 Tax=Parendozoicomonas callyspongiae TaxID=2942213 RepID=A0ABT0PNG0_9GAMM|nr:AHH domain-containing protein [Sansalvadorimonas sp. 2012CJ34-2]MCL6272272.1 AHH domain-containing protein [Sansalvadorimonas sp. 2012CJ34-2]